MTDFPLPQGLRHALLLDGAGGAVEFDWGKVVGLCVALSVLLAVVFRWRKWF